MTRQEVYKSYQNRTLFFEQKVRKVKNKLIWLSISRFLSFIAFFLFIVLSVKEFHPIKVLIALGFLSLFIFLVITYVKETELLNHYKNLVKINIDEKEVLDYNYSDFYSGTDYIDREHAYSYDLDIFGDGSLYQYLNRTVTLVGRELLAKRLLNINTTKNLILQKNEAIINLKDKLDWRQKFIATGYATPITEDDNKKIDLWINEPVFFIKRWFYKALVIMLPVVTLSLLFLLILGITHYSWFTFFALCQLFIASLISRRANREQLVATEELRVLRSYSKLIRLIESESFDSKLLTGHQESLSTDSIQAEKAFKKLIRIIDAFDNRLNLIMGAVLNATLMWDLNSVIRLERWKLKFGKKVKHWVDTIAEFDFYCSLANYAYNNPSFVLPEVSESTIIQANKLGHPLIQESKRVDNDFSLNKPGEIDIITGANMAGKSTFLRTIGVNLVLAMCGLPVAAKEFRFRVMSVFSGMRTADSLKENESYFFAELKRLKNAIEALKKGELTFLLLDEILKGTNSVDKAKGSWKFVEHLVKLKATGIVATHDLTLCNLEKEHPERIKNKCFEVEINGDEINFDYKLRNGVTKNMNASILMKKMGLFSN